MALKFQPESVIRLLFEKNRSGRNMCAQYSVLNVTVISNLNIQIDVSTATMLLFTFSPEFMINSS